MAPLHGGLARFEALGQVTITVKDTSGATEEEGQLESGPRHVQGLEHSLKT